MRLVGVANVLQHLSIEAPSTSENYGPATLLTFEFVSTNSERMQRFFVELLVSVGVEARRTFHSTHKSIWLCRNRSREIYEKHLR